MCLLLYVCNIIVFETSEHGAGIKLMGLVIRLQHAISKAEAGPSGRAV
jgi:hypothetical protein